MLVVPELASVPKELRELATVIVVVDLDSEEAAELIARALARFRALSPR